MPVDEMHYLERELREQLRSVPAVLAVLGGGPLNGGWCRDLETPGEEWVSSSLSTTFGFSEAELPNVAEWTRANLFPEDRALAETALERHAEDPSRPYDQVLRYRHRDGSTVWIRCRGVILRDEAGAPKRLLGMQQDVSALQRAEATLKANAELERRNRDLERLGYMVSHDLRAPLRGIRGFGEVLMEDLEEDAPPEQIRASAERIVNSARRMQEMLDALMALSRIRGEAVEWETFALASVVGDALTDHQAELASGGVKVEVRDLPRVSGSRAQLRSLFSNLIGNALKYRDPERPLVVEVDARAEGERVFVHVRDTGLGFDIQLVERAFSPFVQLHRRGEFSGVGMGLALCREIVALHGGELDADSTVGLGSTFRFSLAAPEGSG